VPAQDGLDAVEINARPMYLDLPVLAADSLQQPVGPLASEVPGAKYSPSALATAFNALVSTTPPDPTSQRNVGAFDDELADFAGRRGATIFID
jgi:hypothetical protein